MRRQRVPRPSSPGAQEGLGTRLINIVGGLITVARSSAPTFIRGRLLDCIQQKTQIEGYSTLLAIEKVVGFRDIVILLYSRKASGLNFILHFCAFGYNFFMTLTLPTTVSSLIGVTTFFLELKTRCANTVWKSGAGRYCLHVSVEAICWRSFTCYQF